MEQEVDPDIQVRPLCTLTSALHVLSMHHAAPICYGGLTETMTDHVGHVCPGWCSATTQV